MYGDSRTSAKGLKDILAGLPGNYVAKVLDAWETDHSALTLVTTSWETWARLSITMDLPIIGVIMGPSLIRGDENPLAVPMTGENMPLWLKGEDMK